MSRPPYRNNYVPPPSSSSFSSSGNEDDDGSSSSMPELVTNRRRWDSSSSDEDHVNAMSHHNIHDGPHFPGANAGSGRRSRRTGVAHQHGQGYTDHLVERGVSDTHGTSDAYGNYDVQEDGGVRNDDANDDVHMMSKYSPDDYHLTSEEEEGTSLSSSSSNGIMPKLIPMPSTSSGNNGGSKNDDLHVSQEEKQAEQLNKDGLTVFLSRFCYGIIDVPHEMYISDHIDGKNGVNSVNGTAVHGDDNNIDQTRSTSSRSHNVMKRKGKSIEVGNKRTTANMPRLVDIP